MHPSPIATSGILKSPVVNMGLSEGSSSLCLLPLRWAGGVLIFVYQGGNRLGGEYLLLGG